MVATESMMEGYNELERQNNYLKVCMEEIKQDRNHVLALLLQHKNCGHADIDNCLEDALARIAGESVEILQQSGAAMLSMQSQMDADTREFMNSSPTSPSNQSQMMSPQNSMSRQNSARSSISDEQRERHDSGISNVDTPPEERTKNIIDSPDDEAISLDSIPQSRVPRMMPNQRIAGSNAAIQEKMTVGPSDLQEPSAFLAGMDGLAEK